MNICRLNRSSKVCLERVPLATRVHRKELDESERSERADKEK